MFILTEEEFYPDNLDSVMMCQVGRGGILSSSVKNVGGNGGDSFYMLCQKSPL